jgi:hypothetical protein
MTQGSYLVNNLLATVKSREVQRAMLAEMRGERTNATLHFLAAAHPELVLANDYEQAGEIDLALRSRISAASCFWRGGQLPQARTLFESLMQLQPAHAAEIQKLMTELAQDYPALAS